MPELPDTALDFTLARPVATLRAQVVSKLREAIIALHFAPGGRLVERQLCDRLGVSRTLVREALRQLESEGWVRILPFRGPVVATMTADEVRALYEVRGALEGLAAKLCAERASAEQLARLAGCVRAMGAARRRGDPVTQREQAGMFYDVLRQAAGNSLLHSQLEALGSRLGWLRAIALSRPERATVSLNEEKALLAALQARDGSLARELCERHLGAAAQALVEAFAAPPGTPSGRPRKPER